MIDKEKVINDLQDAVNDDWMWRHADYYALTMERAIALLKEQPEIIRCKDCDNKECLGREGSVVCGIDGTPHRPDWYCADGERC